MRISGRLKYKLLFSIIFVLYCVNMANAGTIILPNNPNIQYIGRFDKANPLAPICAWTGTQIRAKFEGTSLQIMLKCSAETYFNIDIDGFTTVLRTYAGNNTYTLCSGLKNANHTLVVFKRDSPWVPVTFNGFILDDGKKLDIPPIRKVRKIEFYGDSQTQGARVEVPGSGSDLNIFSYDNNYFSYAAITARALNAEYSVVAQNGATIAPKKEETALPYVFNKMGTDSTSAIWNFNQWIPDVICVNLGINDPINTLDFTDRYVNFVQQLRTTNRNAPIFLLCGPLRNSDTRINSIIDVVKTINSQGDSNVYYYGFKTKVTHPGHARTAENVLCAKELTEKIKSVIWSEITPNLKVEDVYITPLVDTLVIGKKLQLAPTISPFDAKDKKVEWHVANANIAKVNSKGLVTAVALGKTSIQVISHDGKKSASCLITVCENKK